MKAVLAMTLVLAAGPAAGQAVSEKPDAVAVVLYQDHPPSPGLRWGGDADDDPGLAAITETRAVDLPAGKSRIVFQAVADGILPQTAALEGLGDTRLIERNYDFDLLSPGALLQKAVGRTARLVRTNPKTGQAAETPVTVRSGPQGIVLQAADGSAEALGCSGLPEKLVFDGVPPGLNATPTLSVEVEAPRAGHYQVKLSYLAIGLRWGADYVARVRPDGRTLDLFGWLTLANRGATTFGHAPTQVVAGRLAREPGADEPPAAPRPSIERSCWPTAVRTMREYDDVAAAAPPMAKAGLQEVMVTAARKAVLSNLGDYKLYTLPEPTTLAAQQTKQVAFLSQDAVPFRRVYVLTSDPGFNVRPDEAQPASVILRMRNDAADGLGKPLPGGQATLFEPGPDGRAFYAGASRIEDIPVGLPVELQEAAAGDVTLTARRISGGLAKGGAVERASMELTVRNAEPRPVDVEVRVEPQGLTLSAESQPHARRGAFAEWAVTVPAGGERVIRYTVERRRDG